MSYFDATMTSTNIDVAITSTDYITYTVDITSTLGCYVDDIGYYVLIFDTSVTTLTNENIILYGNVATTIAAASEISVSIPYLKYFYNYFVGLSGFNSINHKSIF